MQLGLKERGEITARKKIYGMNSEPFPLHSHDKWIIIIQNFVCEDLSRFLIFEQEKKIRDYERKFVNEILNNENTVWLRISHFQKKMDKKRDIIKYSKYENIRPREIFFHGNYFRW